MNSNSNALCENATLVRLTMKHPSGIKCDKKARSECAQSNSIYNEKLVSVSKHIFGFDINKEFRRIENGIRNDFYYAMTMPWDDATNDGDKQASGWRLCPNKNLDKLQIEINMAEIAFNKERDYAVKEFDARIASANVELGSLFNISDYPTRDEFEAKFIFDFQLQMVPSYNHDIRINCSDEFKKKIEDQAIAKQNANIKNSYKQVVEGLIDSVSHIADKVGEYDPKNKQGGFFNKSSFDNLRKTISNIPAINSDILGDDPAITKAHQSLVKVMSGITNVEGLREDNPTSTQNREDLSKDLKESISDLKGGFMENLYGSKK